MTTILKKDTRHTFDYAVENNRFWARRFYGGPKGRIILYPDWEGARTDWAQEIAAQYAMSCQAEVILTDHYGVDNPSPSFDDAYALNQALLKNPARARPIFAGLVDALEPFWTVSAPLFVVGFCSGGAFALETARATALIDAAFCVHGNPQSHDPLTAASPTSALYVVVHGGDDPIITPDQLMGFEREMRSVKARWSLHIISGAKHSFTRFDSRRTSFTVGYSRRAEVETRLLVRSQLEALLELSET